MLILLLLAILFTSSYGYKIVVYVPDWKEIPENTSFEYITHLNYAFGIPDKNGNIIYNKNVLDKLSFICNKYNINLVFSIGGWSGSKYFSKIVKDKKLLNNFIDDLKSINTVYNISGIDLDWEYPSKSDACFGNIFSNNDNIYFSKILKVIKKELNNIEISMAVPINPWTNNKNDIKDLDYINIMVYDVNGAYWSENTGSNSPYNKILEGVENWKKLGINNSQIIIGLPFYGRTFYTKEDPVNPNIINFKQIGDVKGGPSDIPWEDKCFNGDLLDNKVKERNNTMYNTIWSYSELMESFNETKKWKQSWDTISYTPYAYYYRDKYWYYVSYDNVTSIEKKVRYVKNQNLGGVMAWEITQDYNNTLLNTIYKNLNVHY